jgi:hypothetical protein
MSNISASYPNSIKVFTPVVDGTSTIHAEDVNELQSEVSALEGTLGINPFVGLPYNNLGQTLADLYANKAPYDHQHDHHTLQDLNGFDDHTSYVRVDGTRGFSAPVSAPAATTPGQLATLAQLSALGFTTPAQVTSIVQGGVANLVRAFADSGPLAGAIPGTPSWTLIGGMAQGNLDGNGQLHVTFGGSYFANCLLAFIPTKMVPANGWFAPYDYQNSDCAAITYSLNNVGIQFFQGSAVYAGNPGVGVSFLALGC